MAREIRKRVIRPATPEEKQRHRQIRQQITEEKLELSQWAREVAARQRS
jgi:hypothetical protein